MDLKKVKRLLENGGTKNETSIVDSMPLKFFNPFTMQGLHVHLIEPGRIICSMNLPPRLLNTGNFLAGGVTATLVDLVGAAVMYTVGAPTSGVSVEVNVSYLDAAYADEEIEIEAKALCAGKAIGVASVELRKKKTGKIIALGRHTNYLVISSKL